jgi:hypothetical protein
MEPTDLLDPKAALLAGGVAAVASPRVRRAIRQGVGYGVAGTRKVADAVAGAGRDIYESAREVAGNGDRTPTPAARPGAP